MYDVMEYDGDKLGSPELVLMRSTSGPSGGNTQHQIEPAVADAMARAIVAREQSKAAVAIANCMVQIKELDVMGDTEKTRITQNALSDRCRILQDEQSKRFQRLAEVWDVSTKEQAVTARTTVEVKETTKREAVASMERVEALRVKSQAEVSSNRTLAMAALCFGILSRGILGMLPLGMLPFGLGARRRRRGIPWLTLVFLLCGGAWATKKYRPEWFQAQFLVSMVARRMLRLALPGIVAQSSDSTTINNRQEIELAQVASSTSREGDTAHATTSAKADNSDPDRKE